MNRYQKMSDTAKGTATPEEIETETAEAVKMESIDWLWDKRFALGKQPGRFVRKRPLDSPDDS